LFSLARTSARKHFSCRWVNWSRVPKQRKPPSLKCWRESLRWVLDRQWKTSIAPRWSASNRFVPLFFIYYLFIFLFLFYFIFIYFYFFVILLFSTSVGIMSVFLLFTRRTTTVIIAWI
jgi:hypothetical protein